MTYCVAYIAGAWRVCLLHGTLKQPEPGTYRTARAACRAARQRNAELAA